MMDTEDTEQSFLDAYNIHDYDVPLATVDLAIFALIDDRLQVLLIQRADHPAKGQWSLPGGFVDVRKDHSLEDTAKRKLKEKTDVDAPYLEQVCTVGSHVRDPRGWSMTVVYLSLVAVADATLNAGEGADDVCWQPVEEALAGDLAFDHVALLSTCVDRLRNKVSYTSIPVYLLPDTFTLSELQRTYEILMGKPVEKKSFRRRVLDADILEETGDFKPSATRPAKLYRSTTDAAHFFSRNLEGVR